MFPKEPIWTPSRMISGLIAILYLVSAWLTGGGQSAVPVLLFIILPLLCIWFPDAMGQYTGAFLSRTPISRPSPTGFVWFLGWVLLALPLVLRLLVRTLAP